MVGAERRGGIDVAASAGSCRQQWGSAPDSPGRVPVARSHLLRLIGRGRKQGGLGGAGWTSVRAARDFARDPLRWCHNFSWWGPTSMPWTHHCKVLRMHAGGCGVCLQSFMVTRASHVSSALSIHPFQFGWHVAHAEHLYDFHRPPFLDAGLCNTLNFAS